MFVRRAALGIAAMLAMASLSGQSARPSLRLGALWMDQYPVVNASVECVPSADAPRPCETPKDLRLLEDGAATDPPTGVMALSDTKIGTAMVVALDVSGSMRGRPIEAMQRALAGFAARARTWDKIAVLTFADDVRTDLPFDTDRSALATVLQSVQTRCCNTHLYDALSASIDLLKASGLPPVHRIMVISDGKDEGSRTSSEDVVKRAKNAHVAIDAIGISRIEAVYLRSLETIASQTGGVFRRAESDTVLERLVASGIDQTLAARVASFRLSHIAADGALHTVAIAAPSLSWQEERPLQVPKLEGPAPRSRKTLPILIASAVFLLVGSATALELLRKRSKIMALERSQAAARSAPPRPKESSSVTPATADRKSPPIVAREAAADAPHTRPRRKTVMLHRYEEPRPDRPSAWLSQTSGAGEHFVYALIKSPTWIGTASTATIQLDHTPGILSMHAYIEFEDGNLYLTSESADAKVVVEGEEFSASRRLVLPGNTIRVGNETFRMDLSRPTIE